ncbi:MAG: metalloregulator ArsR/SmtB family transcription factor [Actinobacteria bacterium]|nr:metalloregulator ArsR/SmtB family transcription factor [Actinomycetota bacterium]
MASGRRAEIVELLAQGERTVDEVAATIDQTVANTSHHLRTLARAGLVRTRREGTWVHYALASDDVAVLWAAIRRVAAQQVTDVARLAAAYHGDRDSLVTIGRDELLRRLAGGESCSLTCDPPPSTQRDTSPARSTCRSTSSPSGWTNCPPTLPSSPTARPAPRRRPSRLRGPGRHARGSRPPGLGQRG